VSPQVAMVADDGGMLPRPRHAEQRGVPDALSEPVRFRDLAKHVLRAPSAATREISPFTANPSTTHRHRSTGRLGSARPASPVKPECVAENRNVPRSRRTGILPGQAPGMQSDDSATGVAGASAGLRGGNETKNLRQRSIPRTTAEVATELFAD
jgi:hypothetical protein